jgi:hypothetical protein
VCEESEAATVMPVQMEWMEADFAGC